MTTSKTDQLKVSLSKYSNFYEQLIEHVFISEILQEVWFKFNSTVEVLRSEIDSYGYDIVMESNGIIRHIQLKQSIISATKLSIDAHISLADKPSGCIIWIEWEVDNYFRVKLNYLFFGNKAGNPLPPIDDFKIAKHGKGDSKGVKKERPAKRVIKKNLFKSLSIDELVEYLFDIK